MMVCEKIGCPHPNQLEEMGIGLNELNDWHGYFLWRYDDEDGEQQYTDGQRKAFLDDYRRKSKE